MIDVELLPTETSTNGTLTVVERLANLLETGQFADFTFKVGAGDEATTFKAHKMLLATASQPLHSLVTSCLEQQNGMSDNMTLSVTDIDPESFQHILKYIYTDDVRVSSIGEAIHLMTYSEKWCLDPLGIKTIKFMHQFLDEYEPFPDARKNDLCNLLIWSENVQNGPINKRSWEVMMSNINEIVPCQTFLDMNEDMVKKLLTHEKFRYKNQLMLFEAIRDWGMNQILTKEMNVNQLQSVIAGLLLHINFKDMDDGDFTSTIIPSECLGTADLIGFFLSRGQDMPRDLASANNNKVQNALKTISTLGQEKACRYRKGYKVQESEVYKPHELRFRVDKDIWLLGVGFGFLFSNVDMGITVHCQGPWEIRQWTDIIQTYCRVTWEQLTTTNVKLMFTEPVMIQANQSYKILAKIGRMSAGASEIDLWGGCEGQAAMETKDVHFHILKNAVPPHKEVEEKDKDYSQGIVTDLIYQLEYTPLNNTDNISAPVRLSSVIPAADTLKALNIGTPTSAPRVKSPSTTVISSPIKVTKKESEYNKENMLPKQNNEQKVELPWLNRRTTIVNNREDKPLLNPFRKSRPADSAIGEKVTLPWQRKSSISGNDTVASYQLRKNLKSLNTPKDSTTPDTNNKPWSVSLRSKPSYSSDLNKSSFTSTKNSLSGAPYRNYGSYSGVKNASTTGLNSSSETNKYNSPLSNVNDRSSVSNKYNISSSRTGQPSKDYTSPSSFLEGLSKRPSTFSSSIEKPFYKTNIAAATSYPDRSRVTSFDNKNNSDSTNSYKTSSLSTENTPRETSTSSKYSSTSSKLPVINSTHINPYRTSVSRQSQSRESASRFTDMKSTPTDNSRYQRSTESISKYSQPNSSYERQSNIRNTSTSNPLSKMNQSYSSIKSPSTYSSYNNYRSGDSVTNRKDYSSPTTRYDLNRTTSTSTGYPYTSKLSSITSKWEPRSSTSSYYRR